MVPLVLFQKILLGTKIVLLILGRKVVCYPCPLPPAVFELLVQNCHKLANQQVQYRGPD